MGVHKNFATIHRKTPVLESLFTKVTGLNACNFIKKRLRHRCFPVKFPRILRTSFFKETSGGCFLWVLNRLMGPAKARKQKDR